MLQHPNTALVYEVGFYSKVHYYFTMKLLAGLCFCALMQIEDNAAGGCHGQEIKAHVSPVIRFECDRRQPKWPQVQPAQETPS